MKRIITFNYNKINTADLGRWLKENNYQFDLIHANDKCFEDGTECVGATMIDLVLYSEEAVTAVKIKWNLGAYR